jgi:mannose-6-phosphate isomerase-like protein (cupin superfamily)
MSGTSTRGAGDTQAFLGGRLTLRKLPVVHGKPERPVLDGGRIMLAAGEFAQIANAEEVRFVAYLEFLDGPGLSRGSHYHERKGEALYVLSGRIRARFADPDTRETHELVLERGDLVRTMPRCAHRYEALGYAQAVEFSATPFDASDVVMWDFGG